MLDALVNVRLAVLAGVASRVAGESVEDGAEEETRGEEVVSS